MATNVAPKKGKKKKEAKTLSLQEFLGDNATTVVVKQTKLNWADETENITDDETSMTFSRPFLPTAPRAARAANVDLSKIPTDGPFKAYVGNLPFDVSNEDISKFFGNSKVVDVQSQKDQAGRIRGFAYVEFENRQMLIDALSLNDANLKNRAIKVDLVNQNQEEGRWEGGGNHNRQQDDGEDKTLGNWRKKDPSSSSKYQTKSYSSDKRYDDKNHDENSERYSYRNLSDKHDTTDGRGFNRNNFNEKSKDNKYGSLGRKYGNWDDKFKQGGFGDRYEGESRTGKNPSDDDTWRKKDNANSHSGYQPPIENYGSRDNLRDSNSRGFRNDRRDNSREGFRDRPRDTFHDSYRNRPIDSYRDRPNDSHRDGYRDQPHEISRDKPVDRDNNFNKYNDREGHDYNRDRLYDRDSYHLDHPSDKESIHSKNSEDDNTHRPLNGDNDSNKSNKDKEHFVKEKILIKECDKKIPTKGEHDIDENAVRKGNYMENDEILKTDSNDNDRSVNDREMKRGGNRNSSRERDKIPRADKPIEDNWRQRDNRKDNAINDSENRRDMRWDDRTRDDRNLRRDDRDLKRDDRNIRRDETRRDERPKDDWRPRRDEQHRDDIEPRKEDQDRHNENRPKERPKLNLQPRTKTLELTAQITSNTSSIFGEAKPVDTTQREKEIELKHKYSRTDDVHDMPKRSIVSRKESAEKMKSQPISLYPQRTSVSSDTRSNVDTKESIGSLDHDDTLSDKSIPAPPTKMVPAPAPKENIWEKRKTNQSQIKITQNDDNRTSTTSESNSDDRNNQNNDAGEKMESTIYNKTSSTEGSKTNSDDGKPDGVGKVSKPQENVWNKRKELMTKQAPITNEVKKTTVWANNMLQSEELRPSDSKGREDSRKAVVSVKKNPRERPLPTSIEEMPKLDNKNKKDWQDTNKFSSLMDEEDNDDDYHDDDNSDDINKNVLTEKIESLVYEKTDNLNDSLIQTQ